MLSTLVSPLLILSIFPALLALVLFAYAVRAAKRKRFWGAGARTVSGLVLLLLAVIASLLSAGTYGYYALTREQTAATLRVEQVAPQRFNVLVETPSKQQTYAIAGDEIYVDARIIKWHPWLSVLGVPSAYQLERIAGRYTLIDDEQTEPRTVYALESGALVDLYALRERVAALGWLVDASYGSATFVPVHDGGVYRVQVSVSGLLIRVD